jgi:hypothetical protein
VNPEVIDPKLAGALAPVEPLDALRVVDEVEAAKAAGVGFVWAWLPEQMAVLCVVVLRGQVTGWTKIAAGDALTANAIAELQRAQARRALEADQRQAIDAATEAVDRARRR